ncbi:MAG TPA: MBL fold metallo-hydrolase [Myxococcota bacterium]|nr:MBL fold metallo-hydrolase [Myxococcota bacterium]
MARILGRIALVVGLALAVLAVYGVGRVRALRTETISRDVSCIFGLGGNVGVLRTSEGAVVVDTMTFRMQGDRIRELAEELGGGPVQVVLNTHWHRDHTHGNPAFAPGTKIVATERTLEHLRNRDAEYWTGAAASTLPNETFTDQHEIKLGGKTIRAMHLGRGHTDGDMVVLFVEDRVLHAGDLYFNGLYPNIDLASGGSVKEWGDTLDRVLALDFDRVIPGHGPVSDRAGLIAFQRFIRQLWQVGADAAAKGQSLAEAQRSAVLTADNGYGVMAFPFVMRLDRDFVIQRAWQEATGAVQPDGK